LNQWAMRSAQRGLQPVRWPAPCGDEKLLVSPDIPAPARTATVASVAVDGDASVAEHTATSVKKPAAAAVRPSRLDLWPAEKPAEHLEAIGGGKDTTDREVVVLQNGVVHLVGFIPPDLQQRIVDTMREVGLSQQGFFPEAFDGIKQSPGVIRTYLGRHWNATSQMWEQQRGNENGAAVAELPKLLTDMYAEAVGRANRELKTAAYKKRNKVLPEGKPNVGVVNFYPPGASMQPHQDTGESKESIGKGYPVMGLCIGDACKLAYGDEAPKASKTPKALRLESGDVYLFGADARMLWHGITEIFPRTAPVSLRLIPGRLNVTLRVL